MRPFGECTLYLITDRTLSRGRSTVDVVRAALAGGVGAVQLRDKEAEAAAIVDEGLRVHELTARYQVPLIVNDRVDIALAIEAEGRPCGTDRPAGRHGQKAAASTVSIGCLHVFGRNGTPRSATTGRLRRIRPRLSDNHEGDGGFAPRRREDARYP